jgi:head-tail adaptor
MLSPWSFDSRITVQAVTKTFDGLNSTETWNDVETIWGSLIQLTQEKQMKVVMEYGQRFSKNIYYKLVVRGRKAFSFSDTRFLYQSPTDGVRTLKPIESVRIPGSRHDQYTGMWVEDVTDVAVPE